jgi:hypothetical protein
MLRRRRSSTRTSAARFFRLHRVCGCRGPGRARDRLHRWCTLAAAVARRRVAPLRRARRRRVHRSSWLSSSCPTMALTVERGRSQPDSPPRARRLLPGLARCVGRQADRRGGPHRLDRGRARPPRHLQRERRVRRRPCGARRLGGCVGRVAVVGHGVRAAQPPLRGRSGSRRDPPRRGCVGCRTQRPLRRRGSEAAAGVGGAGVYAARGHGAGSRSRPPLVRRGTGSPLR